MSINSKLVAVATVSAVAGATFLGANSVSAQASGQSLVSRIAERFSVSETEVQSVIDEYKEDVREERQAERDEHLQGLVDDGTLTEEQRAQLDEFFAQRQELKEELKGQDLSREEMKEAFEEHRAEVEAWAEAEGLDLDDIRPERDGERKRGHHKEGLRDALIDEFDDEDAEDDDEDDVEDEDDEEELNDEEDSEEDEQV